MAILFALFLGLPCATPARADSCIDFIGDQVKSLDPSTLVAEGKAAFEAAQCAEYSEDPVFIALTSVLVGLKAAGKISDKDQCENAIDGVLGKAVVALLQQSGPLWDALPGDLKQSIVENSGKSLKDIPGIDVLLNQFNCACVVATNPAVDQIKKEAQDGYGCAAEVEHAIEDVGSAIVSGPVAAVDYIGCKLGLGGCDDPPKDEQCNWVQCGPGTQCGGGLNDQCVACPDGAIGPDGFCGCNGYLTEVSHTVGSRTIVDACQCQSPLHFVSNGTGGATCGCPNGLAIKGYWDGSKDVYTCEACPAGQVAGADGYGCSFCPTDQIADANGQCNACAQGAHTAWRTSADGSKTQTCTCPGGMGFDIKNINGQQDVYCKACIGDVVSRWDHAACVPCPANAKPEWSKGQQATVCRCEEGFVFVNSNPNDYSDATGTHGQCVSKGPACPAGKHRDGIGGPCVNANGCLDGQVMTYANEVQGTTCQACSSPSQTVVDNKCASCPAGQAGDGLGGCFGCPAGSTSDGQGGPCVFGCPPGQFYSGATYNIVTGQATPGSGNGSCEVCPLNAAPDATATACVAITGTPGLPSHGSHPAWPMPPGLLNAVTNCTDSDYAVRRDARSQGCAVCPLGSRANWDHTACVATIDPLFVALMPAAPILFTQLPRGASAFNPIPSAVRAPGRPAGPIVISLRPGLLPSRQSFPVRLTPPPSITRPAVRILDPRRTGAERPDPKPSPKPDARFESKPEPNTDPTDRPPAGTFAPARSGRGTEEAPLKITPPKDKTLSPPKAIVHPPEPRHPQVNVAPKLSVPAKPHAPADKKDVKKPDGAR